jgi:hypothetical protein
LPNGKYGPGKQTTVQYVKIQKHYCSRYFDEL